jgi:hypothetical protein
VLLLGLNADAGGHEATMELSMSNDDRTSRGIEPRFGQRSAPKTVLACAIRPSRPRNLSQGRPSRAHAGQGSCATRTPGHPGSSTL